jgi:hypothetical protein
MDGARKTDPHAWYIFGFIQKERYTASQSPEHDNPERLSAIQAFQRCRQLAPMSEDARNAITPLKWLAESYYRDAKNALTQFSPGSDERVLALLNRYKSTWLELQPESVFTDQEFDIYQGLARANGDLLEPALGLPEHTIQAAFERAVSHYEKAESLRPEDDRIQFNLAVTWYNEGVRKIRAIHGEVTLAELMRIQAECVAYFKRALEPMEAAYDLNPQKAYTLNGLMIIHRALENQEASERFRAELEALKE